MKGLLLPADMRAFRVRSLIVAGGLLALTILVPSAHAFVVRAEPSVIIPGDAFLVRISAGRSAAMPEASFGGRPLLFTSCGGGCYVAIGAADLKTAPGRQTIVVNFGTKKKRLPITIRRHLFPVTHLSLPPGRAVPSAEDMQRIEREDKLLRSLWAKQSEKAWQGSFSQPLENEISTQYGVKRIINKTNESIHRGVDIRGREGEAVKAANSGMIVLAEELYYGGNTLVLDHGIGIFTVYMHLSGFNRNSGENVSKGDVIGFVGSTGRSTGPHLHFGIKVQDLSVNPVSFAKLKL